jgi:hypothetical protein
MEQVLTRVFRYSNTLLVSLNNRIYFRDRPIAITVDTEHAVTVSSDNSRRFAITSHFSQGHPPTNTNTTDEGIKLHSIPDPMRIGESKGDEASISSGARRVPSILTDLWYF